MKCYNSRQFTLIIHTSQTSFIKERNILTFWEITTIATKSQQDLEETHIIEWIGFF
jgi:hypothetical protein